MAEAGGGGQNPYDYRLERPAQILLGSGQQTRATQSFVGVLSRSWKRPSGTALEVMWRWLFGIPTLYLLYRQGMHVLMEATSGTMDPLSLGLDHTFLNDPVGVLSANPGGVAGKISVALGVLLPGTLHAAAMLAPPLLVAWAVVSGLGRTLVLRRIDPTLRPRPFTLMALHAIRVGVLAGVLLLWLRALIAVGRAELTEPIAAGAEPNLLGYCALVIVISLGLFTAWGFVSWLLAVAPLLAMRDGTGVFASLRAATRLSGVRGKLAEINLVLAIVKIALIVLAMTFSATPLPFESVTTPTFLAWWWAGVALIYILWSDFFHVARLAGYLDILRDSLPAADSRTQPK